MEYFQIISEGNNAPPDYTLWAMFMFNYNISILGMIDGGQIKCADKTYSLGIEVNIW